MVANFTKNDIDYTAEISIYDDEYYVRNFYSINWENVETYDIDYREFIDEIEEQIRKENGFVPGEKPDYGGCDNYLDGLKQSYY